MKHKIVIIGAGFAGLQLAKNLDEELFEVLLIDKLNHHQFQPLFYQVATSQIEPSSISFPLRNIFKGKKNIDIRMAEVTRIVPETNTIETTIGQFGYDTLVIAVGCKTNFFGNKNIEKHAYTLKSTYEAIGIRNHILTIFEKILSATETDKEALYNLVIVGAGPTGAELAGAFAEIKKYILPKDYPRLDMSRFTITLVEGSNHTLNNMSDNAKAASQKYLTELGVKIITETLVKDYDGTTAILDNGQTIPTSTVIWTAGVTPNTIEGIPDDVKTKGNRILVDRTNKILQTDNIYAIGDIALMTTPLYPKGHPQLANVAINQGKTLAKNLKRILNLQTVTPYEYKDLGSMATIGTNKAVVDLPYTKFSGRFAWFVWMFLHLMLILSVRNKLIIFINWAWVYLTKNTSLRLILTDKDASSRN